MRFILNKPPFRLREFCSTLSQAHIAIGYNSKWSASSHCILKYGSTATNGSRKKKILPFPEFKHISTYLILKSILKSTFVCTFFFFHFFFSVNLALLNSTNKSNSIRSTTSLCLTLFLCYKFYENIFPVLPFEQRNNFQCLSLRQL